MNVSLQLLTLGSSPESSCLFGSATGECMSNDVDFGSSCRQWDLQSVAGIGAMECRGPSPIPDWCSQPWCYVDITECSIGGPKAGGNWPSLDSSKRYHFRGSPLEPRLFYSYATCGTKDVYTGNRTKIDARLYNRTFRAASPHTVRLDWHVIRNATKLGDAAHSACVLHLLTAGSADDSLLAH